MRKVKFLSIFVLLALLLSAGSGRVVIGQEPPTEWVPTCVPPNQVPDEVNIASVRVSVQAPSSEEQPTEKWAPRRVPPNEVPEEVNYAVYTKTVRIPSKALGLAQPLDNVTVTLTYGFHWYQYSPYFVAVRGIARTQTDSCVQRIRAQAKLYYDPENDGTFTYLDQDVKDVTGICVTDSGLAATGYWTAPNGTNWKVKTYHLITVNGQTSTWEFTKYDSFP